MNNDQHQEVETKFYLAYPRRLRERLLQLGAQPEPNGRVHELNLRFDTPGKDLSRQRRVLRLRQDSRARLTYKDPALPDQAVSVRREIEFEVSNFDTAKLFLEALGYQVSVTYEKYRTTFFFHDTEVTIDEMPYGTFCEIEAADGEQVRRVAQELGLKWEARCPRSYLELFYMLRERRGQDMSNLDFASFIGMSFEAQDFNLEAADLED